MSRLRRILVPLGLTGFSLLFFGFAVELVLRLFPSCLPAGAYYGSGAYDPELGFYLPTAPVIYNKTRFLTRVPNRDGFMDVDHEREKDPGVVRVGLFGDSYVESIQVPLTQTFFRRLPSTLAGQKIEPMAFGISGLGTLHSLMLHRKLGPRYDLDVVVYFFVENDPGDHLHSIQKKRPGVTTPRPTAGLAPVSRDSEMSTTESPGFVIHWPPAPDDKPAYLRAAMFAKNHSLFARVVYSRLQLLWQPSPTDSSRSPSSATERDLPGQWPQELRAEAEALSFRLLARFKAEVESQGRRFLVFYVPRGTALLDGSLGVEDTWLPWLEAACTELNIDWVDPRNDLKLRLDSGEEVYGDHWTPAGHQVVAEVTARALTRILGEGPKDHD